MTFEQYLERASAARTQAELRDVVYAFREQSSANCLAYRARYELEKHMSIRMATKFLIAASVYGKNGLGALLLVGLVLYLNNGAEEDQYDL